MDQQKREFFLNLLIFLLPKNSLFYLFVRIIYIQFTLLCLQDSPKKERYTKWQKPWVDSYLADGNNVEDVYRLTKQAVAEIKEVGKPRFIELSTYRWLEHCGPNFDNDIGYRSPEEFKAWKKKDPIELYIKILLEKKIITKTDIVKIKKEIKQEVKKAFSFAKESPFPDSKDAFRSLFA